MLHHVGALLYLFECLSEFKFKFEFIWLGFELEIEIGNRVRIRKGKPAQNPETSPARPTSSSNPNSPAHTFPRGPFSHRQPSSFSPLRPKHTHQSPAHLPAARLACFPARSASAPRPQPSPARSAPRARHSFPRCQHSPTRQPAPARTCAVARVTRAR